MRHGAFHQIVRLISRGVPWHEAWKMPETMRFAWCVALGEIEGGTFNWETGQWSVSAAPG